MDTTTEGPSVPEARQPGIQAEPGVRSGVVLDALSRVEGQRGPGRFVRDVAVAAIALSVLLFSMYRIVRSDLELLQSFAAWAPSILLVSGYVALRYLDILICGRVLLGHEQLLVEAAKGDGADEPSS